MKEKQEKEKQRERTRERAGKKLKAQNHISHKLQ